MDQVLGKRGLETQPGSAQALVLLGEEMGAEFGDGLFEVADGPVKYEVLVAGLGCAVDAHDAGIVHEVENASARGDGAQRLDRRCLVSKIGTDELAWKAVRRLADSVCSRVEL